MYGCHYAAARVCGWLHCGRVSLGVGSRRWEQILYVLREVRGASGWLKGHSGRHTSLSYDPRALRDRLLGLHSRRALSLPTSPTTCIACARGLSLRARRPPTTCSRTLTGETIVYTRTGRAGARRRTCAHRAAVDRAELGLPSGYRTPCLAQAWLRSSRAPLVAAPTEWPRRRLPHARGMSRGASSICQTSR